MSTVRTSTAAPSFWNRVVDGAKRIVTALNPQMPVAKEEGKDTFRMGTPQSEALRRKLALNTAGRSATPSRTVASVSTAYYLQLCDEISTYSEPPTPPPARRA